MMSTTKGVAVFPNRVRKNKLSQKKNVSLYEKWYIRESWHKTFKHTWENIEKELRDLHHRTYSLLLADIINYISMTYSKQDQFQNLIPSATLMLGGNQLDHSSMFETLTSKLRSEVTPHVAMAHSHDSTTVKQLVENVVYQLIFEHNGDDMDISDNEFINKSPTKPSIKKNECTLTHLRKWYEKIYSSTTNKQSSPTKKKKSARKSLVIVIQDFECFSYSVLQNFILILSSYTPALPIVLVFGVTTSISSLYKSFPYNVSSKLLIKGFQSHTSLLYLNQVLEEIFLTHKCSFLLSATSFELLIDLFLFYDLSLTGLIERIKYCLMEHFYCSNIKSLCCECSEVNKVVRSLEPEQLEEIRHLMSFRPYLEQQSCVKKIALFEDESLREDLCKNINNFHDYLFCFYTSIRMLCVFVKDLPKNMLGKTVREIYTKCMKKQHIDETAAFKESMLLLNVQSQSMLVSKLKDALKVLRVALQSESLKSPTCSPLKSNLSNQDAAFNNVEYGVPLMKKFEVHLHVFLRQIENASKESTIMPDIKDDVENAPRNRFELKQQLKKSICNESIQSEFAMVRSRLVGLLEEVFKKTLQSPYKWPYHEIFMFDNIISVKTLFTGSPRGIVHVALSNPHTYLQCSCCYLRNTDSIINTLPDLSVAYKLHLECSKHINLYDWLQAFTDILDPMTDDDDDERRVVAPQMQARFHRVVADLEFLGFIKPSKRKTDHVMKLTW